MSTFTTEEETKAAVVDVGVIGVDWFRVTFEDDDENAVEFTSEYTQDDEEKRGFGCTFLVDSKIIDDDNSGVAE